MKNVADIKNCYGCGVCATICPQRVIEICLNENGFYEPKFSAPEKCTDCGLCRDVCSYLHDERSRNANPIMSYASWSNDPTVRMQCSSGGVGFEIARYLLAQGYRICAVRYNAEKERAEHYIANSEEELWPSVGSKYIQSYTLDAFREIRKGEKYLVIGTPCQIDSFHRYAKKLRIDQNFIFMDFFCHGVPSMWLWKKYLKDVEKKTGKALYVSWRNKRDGWHDSWAMSIYGETHAKYDGWKKEENIYSWNKKSINISKLSEGDVFFRLFLSDGCLGKACYDKCKFKWDKSSADIRIGDFLGKTYRDNNEGISCAVAFSEKGYLTLQQSNVNLVGHKFETVAQGQMLSSPFMPKYYEKLRKSLNKQDSTIKDVDRIVLKAQKIDRLMRIIRNPFAAAANLINRLSREN